MIPDEYVLIPVEKVFPECKDMNEAEKIRFLIGRGYGAERGIKGLCVCLPPKRPSALEYLKGMVNDRRVRDRRAKGFGYVPEWVENECIDRRYRR